MPAVVLSPAVATAVDVTLWFLEKARSANCHLPAQKLQNLLYLACVAYEREHGGAALMPAAFVRNELAVVEPNLYRLLEEGRPRIRSESLAPPIQQFLETIWSRYAHSQVSHLNHLVTRRLDSNKSERIALAAPQKEDGIDTLEATVKSEATEVRPTHLGRHVAVAPWRPPMAPKRTS